MVLENFQVAIAIIFAAVIYLYHKISVEMSDKDHFPLKLFFFFMSVWFSIIAVYYSRAVAYTNLVNASANATIMSVVNTAILAQYPIMVFVTGYFMIYFVQKLFLMYIKPK